jgi:hypothetical protein
MSNCAKTHKMSALIAAVLSEPHPTEAIDEIGLPEAGVGEGMLEFFLNIGVVMVHLQTPHVRLSKMDSSKNHATKRNCGGRGQFLPCPHRNGQWQDHEKAQCLYLSVQSNRANPGLTYKGTIPYIRLKLTKMVLFRTITIPWNNGTFEICWHAHPIELSKVVYVTFYQLPNVRRILATDYFVHVIILISLIHDWVRV